MYKRIYSPLNLFHLFTRKVTLLVMFVVMVTEAVAQYNPTMRMTTARPTIAQAFKTIESQTGLLISYDQSFDTSKRVDMPQTPTSLSAVMRKLLHGTGRTYVITNGNIAISRPPKNETAPVVARQKAEIPIVSTQTLEGSVSIENNQKKVVNAEVVAQSSKNTYTTTTDQDGDFKFENLPLGLYKVKVSHTYYRSLENEVELTVQKGERMVFEFIPTPQISEIIPQTIVPTQLPVTVPSKVLLQAVTPSVEHKMPVFALKTNLVHDAFATINFGVELRLSDRLTLDVPFSVNQWKNEKRKNIFLVQPELRWWTNEPFNGHFIGFHAHFAHFGVGAVDVPLGIWDSAKDYHFQGDLFGAGFSYGYQWILSKRFNIEVNLGLGYFYAKYDKFDCRECNAKVETGSAKHYLGPTKLGVSLIYIIK